MNKADLIKALAEHYDGSKTEAARALNAVVQTITFSTAAGEKVSITGFGVFEKVPRGERIVRNPRTGERKKAEPTAIPRFRPGTDLKAYVSGAKPIPKTTIKQPASDASDNGRTELTEKRGTSRPARRKSTRTATASSGG